MKINSLIKVININIATKSKEIENSNKRNKESIGCLQETQLQHPRESRKIQSERAPHLLCPAILFY
jgi:hypothetical protein